MTSPYRNEIDALRERKESLEAELQRLRTQTTELESLRAREGSLASELADVERRIGATETKRSLPMLDRVRVASPCNADWNEMVGDERVRFCLSCEKNVYNLSALPREDAEQLLRDRLGGELCVRFYQRADGTILTDDCPVGVSKKRRKKIALAVAGAGAMALAAVSALGTKTTCRTQGAVSYRPSEPDPVVQGEMKMGDVSPIDERPPVPAVMGSAAPTTEVHPEPKVHPKVGAVAHPR